MKWSSDETLEAELGTRRNDKAFMWLPLTLPIGFRFKAKKETRWLCWATIQQQYRKVHQSDGEGMGGFYEFTEWVDECWLD